MGSMSFVGDDIACNVNMDLTLAEIHNLAYFYHWGREECWNTPCNERGVFNDQIRKQLKAENGSSSNGSTSNKPKYKESF
jgi:hypothetical protein|nr:MAG TPA: hypothetical protein [Caudoviricetes sp.]